MPYVEITVDPIGVSRPIVVEWRVAAFAPWARLAEVTVSPTRVLVPYKGDVDISARYRGSYQRRIVRHNTNGPKQDTPDVTAAVPVVATKQDGPVLEITPDVPDEIKLGNNVDMEVRVGEKDAAADDSLEVATKVAPGDTVKSSVPVEQDEVAVHVRGIDKDGEATQWYTIGVPVGSNTDDGTEDWGEDLSSGNGITPIKVGGSSGPGSMAPIGVSGIQMAPIYAGDLSGYAGDHTAIFAGEMEVYVGDGGFTTDIVSFPEAVDMAFQIWPEFDTSIARETRYAGDWRQPAMLARRQDGSHDDHPAGELFDRQLFERYDMAAGDETPYRTKVEVRVSATSETPTFTENDYEEFEPGRVYRVRAYDIRVRFFSPMGRRIKVAKFYVRRWCWVECCPPMCCSGIYEEVAVS